MQNKPISAVIAALIISGIMIIYSLLLTFTGMNVNQTLSWLTYLILMIGVIVFVNMYGKAKNYSLGFGGLFGYGFKVSAITALIVVAFTFILYTAFPEFKEKVFEAMRTNMENDERVSDADIDRAIEMGRRYFMIGLVGGGLFFTLLCGTIGSLIGAAVTKKVPANPMDQLDV